MFRLTKSDLNLHKECPRGSSPLLCDVELRQILHSVFWRVGRSSFLLLALLLLPVVLRAQPIAPTPNALDLGVVGVGVEARAAVSLKNLQDDALEVFVGIRGAGFGTAADTLRLDAEGVGRVEVHFKGAAPGEYAGDLILQVAALFADERVIVPLQAVAVVPTLVLWPAEGLDFGAVPVGRAATGTLVVKNTGHAPVPAGRMALADPQGPFRLEGDVGPWPAPGAEAQIDVAFAPTHAGPAATEFAVTSPGFGDWSIPLRGRGLVPQAAFSPLPQVGLDFGPAEVGQRLTRRVTVLNRGQAELYLKNADIEGAAFALGAEDSAATIASEGRLDLSAAFAPPSEGDHRGVLRLHTSDPQAAMVAIPLAGRGQISPPRIEVLNGALDLGSVPIGETARAHLLLWNRGGRPGVVNIAKVADEGVEFELEQPSVLVQPGASAQVALRFSPKEAGPRQAALHVEVEAQHQTVRLQGVGQFLALSPATIDLGRIAVGQSSSRVVEIANVGNADFEIHQIRSTSAEFSAHTPIDADNKFLLPAHSQRTLPLHVTFSPSARGAISGTLRLDGLGAHEMTTLDILLKGSGIAAEIDLHPAGLVDFGYVALGQQAERTFVATNVGDTVLQVEAHPQSEEAHVAPARFALAPGESARLALFFAPEALGERRGRVLLVSNDVKDRARPLEYKGQGVLADIDLAQIIEVLVSHGEKTQPLVVGWDNTPVVQKDGTKVDVAFAVSDSLRPALIGRELVVEWTRLDENYAPKSRGSSEKQKVTLYESSGGRVLAEDLNLRLSEEDNRRVRLKITTHSYPGGPPQSVSQLLEAGGWKWEFEAKPLVSFLTIRPGRDYTDGNGDAVQGQTERLIGLPGLAFAGWHNVDNPFISGIHFTAIGNVLEALSTENSLAISLGVAVSFYKDQFLFGFGWDIYDSRPRVKKKGSQDYIMTFKYSGLFK